MATNNSRNFAQEAADTASYSLAYRPQQPTQAAFDPQAFADTLYAKMGAKRTPPPMLAQQPTQSTTPAQTDLYAQPQRPIRTPFQEQMDRERAARSLREQARATFYQNPANFRYGARQDPNQVAQFDAANQRAIAAERLAADAARARQTVSPDALNRTPQQVAAANASLLIQEAAQARANADRLRPQVDALRASGDMAGAAALEAQIAEFSRRASTASGNPMYDANSPEAMRRAAQSAANQQVMAVRELENIGRSRANLRRAAANEQQVRDQQAAEAEKMRADEERRIQIIRRIEEASADRAAALAAGDKAKADLAATNARRAQSEYDEFLATSDSRKAAARATNVAAGREAGARADLLASQAGMAQMELQFLNLPEVLAHRKTKIGLEIDKIKAEIDALRTQGKLNEVEAIDAQNRVNKALFDAANQLPPNVQQIIKDMVPEGVDRSKTALALLANADGHVGLSNADMTSIINLSDQIKQIENSMASMTDAQKSQVKNVMLAWVRSFGIDDPSITGAMMEALFNPIDSGTVLGQEIGAALAGAPSPGGAFDQMRADIVSRIRSIVTAK